MSLIKKLVIGIAMVVALGYGVVQGVRYLNFRNLREQCYQKIANADSVITVYFDTQTDFSKLQSIGNDIQSSQPIKSVLIKSSADALQELVQAHAGDPVFQAGVNDLDMNPMQPYITVTLRMDQDQSVVSNYIKQETQKYGISIASTNQTASTRRKVMLQRISEISYERRGRGNEIIRDMCINVPAASLFSEYSGP